MMECRDIDELVVDYLYQELDAAKTAELEGHLSSCPRCKAEIGSLQRTRLALRDLPEIEPSPAVSTRLLHEASKRAPRSSGWLGWLSQLFQPVLAHPAWMAGVTAVVIIGVMALFTARHIDVNQPTMSAVQPTTTTSTSTPTSAPPAAPTAPPTESYVADQPRPVRESGEAIPEAGKVASPAVAAAQKGSGQGYDKAAATGRIASDGEMKPIRAMKKEAAVSKDAKRSADNAPEEAIKPSAEPPAAIHADEADDRIAQGEKSAPAKPSPRTEAPAEKEDSNRRRADNEERQAAPAAAATAAPAVPPPAAAPEPTQHAQGAGGPPGGDSAKTAAPASPEQQLFQQAQNEAAGGRCQSALAIAQKIQRQNPDFYKRRIVGDPTLRTCSEQLRKQQAPAKAKSLDRDLESPAPAQNQQKQ